jgi:pectin methylesterase-like acyl-CoA thioesterase
MPRILQQISLRIFLAVSLSVAAFASTLQVGSGQTYTTIGACITAASSGDTCNIHAGTYTEQLTMKAALSCVTTAPTS